MAEARSNDCKALRVSTADMVNQGGIYKWLQPKYPNAIPLDKDRKVPRGYRHPICAYLISHPGLDFFT
jgi:hypothetical protein